MSIIHQEILFSATPERVYDALTDAKQFASITGGAPTDISREAGGAFSCFGGMIVGRQLELISNERIVQAWRVANWPAGNYSIATFKLEPQDKYTKVVFEQVGFPEDQKAHLDTGWHTNYWEPLKAYLKS